MVNALGPYCLQVLKERQNYTPNTQKNLLMILKGTKFQIKVWEYLKTIPKGKVKTYKQVAIGINNPKAARAVANACAKNPYAPKYPVIELLGRIVHWVVSLGPGGTKTKKKLLKKEGFSL